MESNIFKYWKPKYSGNEVFNKHPSCIYETENMSSVELPDIYQKMLLKSNSIKTNEYISDVQMEAISHAINSVNSDLSINNLCRGFFLGDGTGVGKSRSIGGILTELFLQNNTNYRAIWVSINKNLNSDAFNEMKIIKNIGNAVPDWLSINDIKNSKDGIHFTTYGSLINEKTFSIILDWLSQSSNVTLVFDEAHTAKSSNSKKSKSVLKLQNELYNPRVIYSTATAANNIHQMHYMVRLGLWNNDHKLFVKQLEKYGSTAMEMAALQLKHSGKLVSRHLGFDGVSIVIKYYKLSKEE